MTIEKRLARSNIAMLAIPLITAAALAACGALVLLRGNLAVLYDAVEQAEKQKKQKLIAGMSHDLKSPPLTSIRAYSEALLAARSGPKTGRRAACGSCSRCPLQRRTHMPKILIIEDDPDIAAIERDYLELSGYEAVICADGTAGLNAALTESYDLLLLGLMLGSAYAIVNGPASLSTPLPPMNLTSFRWPAFLLGIVLLLALELLKQAWDRLAALRAGTRN